MTAVDVTINQDRPDHIEIDGKHYPDASFEYKRGDDGVRRIVVTWLEGAAKFTFEAPVAKASFGGDTKRVEHSPSS